MAYKIRLALPLIAAISDAPLLLLPQHFIRRHVFLRLAQLPVFAHFRLRLARVRVLCGHARYEVVLRPHKIHFRVAGVDATSMPATTPTAALALRLVPTREAQTLAVLRVGRASTGSEETPEEIKPSNKRLEARILGKHSPLVFGRFGRPGRCAVASR